MRPRVSFPNIFIFTADCLSLTSFWEKTGICFIKWPHSWSASLIYEFPNKLPKISKQLMLYICQSILEVKRTNSYSIVPCILMLFTKRFNAFTQRFHFKKFSIVGGASLLVQWVRRARLAMAGHGFNPWLGTKIPHAVEQQGPRATTREPMCYN